jgi:hypothetical protein
MSFKKLALAGGVVASLMASTAYASVIDRPFFQVLGVVVVWSGDANGDPIANDFVLLTPAGTATDLIGGNGVVDGVTVVTGELDRITGTDTALDPNAAAYDPAAGTGVLDASASLTAFGIDATTDIGAGLVGSHNSSFFVASNAGFQIQAVVSNVTATEDFSSFDENFISFDMSVTESGDVTTGGDTFGSAAWIPHVGADSATNGVNPGIETLGDIGNTNPPVYNASRRTAETTGTLMEQSVRFDNVYNLDADPATPGVQAYDLSMGVGTLSADVTYTIFAP